MTTPQPASNVAAAPPPAGGKPAEAVSVMTPPPSDGGLFGKAFKAAVTGDSDSPPSPPTPPTVPQPAKAGDKAPEPTKAEEADDTPPEVKSPEGKNSWQKLKGIKAAIEKERDEIKAERDTMKVELAKLNERLSAATRSADPVELAALKKERDALSETVERLNIEAHPKFKAYYDSQQTRLVDMAKAIVPAERRSDVERWLNQPDSEVRTSALEEVIAELSPLRAGQFTQAIARMAEIRSERASEVEKAKENSKLWQAQQQSESERQQAQARQQGEQLFSETLERMSKTLPTFAKSDGDPEATKEADEAVGQVKHLLFGENKPQALVEAAFWSVYGRRAGDLLKGAVDEIQRLTEQVQQLTSGQPRPPEQGASEAKPASPTSFAEAVRKAMTGE